MGLRLKINNLDFSNNNIGNISEVPIEGISISKEDGIGNFFKLITTFTPSNTTDTDVIYSIISGDAAISGDFVRYFSTGDVVVRCESVAEPSVYDEKTFSVTHVEQNIVFQDNIVKGVLVDNFDTDNDGEISLDEAAAANPFTIMNANSSIFKNVRNTIEYFNEFKYFIQNTNATIASGSLKSIELPSSIKTLSEGTYYSNLESFVFNSKVALIPNGYFANSKLTSIEVWATAVDTYAFKDSTSLTNVKFKEGLESVSGSPFYGTSTQVIDFPSTLISCTGQLFRCTSMQKMIIRATTPPTWYNPNLNGMSNDLAIYVPDASVSAYKAAAGWSLVESRIHPLSDIED